MKMKKSIRLNQQQEKWYGWKHIVISIILKIFENLNKIISNHEQNLFDKIDILIKNREIILIEDEIRNPHHTIKYKSPFYYILEALLRICISEELFIKFQGQDFYDFINLLKTITKDSLFINEDLNLYSKEIYTIQEFLEIEEGLNQVNKSNEENLLII